VPFDDKKFNGPPTNGDVAAVAIAAALGFSNIAFALEALEKGDKADLKKEIANIRKNADDLDEIFTAMTGYTADGS
jgi:hypothetical protein